MQTISLKLGGPFQKKVSLALHETHNCIVGINGSGKTTLAKALSGYFIEKCGGYSAPYFDGDRHYYQKADKVFEDHLTLIQERGISWIQFSELLNLGLSKYAYLQEKIQAINFDNAHDEIIKIYSESNLSTTERAFFIPWFYIALCISIGDAQEKRPPLILDCPFVRLNIDDRLAIKNLLERFRIQYVLITHFGSLDLETFKPTHVIQVRGAGRDANPAEIISGVPLLYCADGDAWASTLVTLP